MIVSQKLITDAYEYLKQHHTVENNPYLLKFEYEKLIDHSKKLIASGIEFAFNISKL